MKEFEVSITETLQKNVTIEAASREEAERMAEDMWREEDIVLDSGDFVGVEFKGGDGKEVDKEAPKSMEVLLVEPGQYAKITTINSDLKSMQDIVGGSIEAAYFFDEPVALVCNEDGKNIGLPLNRAVRNNDGDVMDIIAGKFFVCGLSEDSFASLPEKLQDKFKSMFRQPETFLKMGRSIAAIPTEPIKPTAKKEKGALATEL